MQNFINLFIQPLETNLLYLGNYDLVWVVVSIFVTVLAAYAVLHISRHIAHIETSPARCFYVFGAGLCMGVGIWLADFFNMRAFSVPRISVDCGVIGLMATVSGVLASILAVNCIARREPSNIQIVAAGFLFATSISVMHYSEMEALQLKVMTLYDLRIFLLSILIAVVLSTLSLWISFRLQAWTEHVRTSMAALVLGAAIFGMHYMAMLFAYSVRDGEDIASSFDLAPTLPAFSILLATSLMLVITMMLACSMRSSIASTLSFNKKLTLWIVAWVVVSWLGVDYYFSQRATEYYQRETELASFQVDQVTSNIDKSLDMFNGIARMSAREQDARQVLHRFGARVLPSRKAYKNRKQDWLNDPKLQKLNELLRITSKTFDADNIFLLNAAGDCVAAGNADAIGTPVGENFAGRAYFEKARMGLSSQQYAVGRTTHVPGLYFASPVLRAGKFIGIAVVKLDISKFSYWTNQFKAFLSDSNGVVILASDSHLKFHYLPNALYSAMSAERRKQRYGDIKIEELTMYPYGEDDKFPFTVQINGQFYPTALASKNLLEHDITVHVARHLEKLTYLKQERNWIFLLLSVTGSMLIVGIFSLLMHLRTSRKTAADLRIASRIFESQEGMMIMDANNLILRVNRAFTRITGYKIEEVVGKSPSMLAAQAHYADVQQSIRLGVDSMGVWEGEILAQRKNGEIFPEYLAISCVKDGDFQPVNYVATFTDISERKKIESALKESEAKFRQLFSDASDPVLLLKDGRFIDCNEATIKLLGYDSKSDFINASPATISPEFQADGRSSAEKSEKMDAAALRKGSHQFDWQYSRRDGFTIPVEVTLTSITVDGEQILHVLWREISERKRIEAEVKRLSNAYRLLSRVNATIARVQNKQELLVNICKVAVETELLRFVWVGLLDQARDFVQPIAHAGVEDGYVSKLNIRLSDEKTGVGPTSQAILTRSPVFSQDILHDPTMEVWRKDALIRGYHASGVFPLTQEDVVVGSINFYASEAYFFTEDMQVLMQELASDVSFALDVFAEKARREKAEEEIKQLNIELERRVVERTYQLETANRELEAFSYSVSHDLRAPLRSIDGFSQILSKKYHDNLDETGQDYLERVCRASQHMGHLIDDLLQLSQVTRGKLKREKTDLSGMAEAIMEELHKLKPERNMQFSVQPGMFVHADPGLMRVALYNLISNACKYTGKKEIATIEFAMQDDEGEAVFFMRDNGAGFNMVYADKLFGAFQRLHSASEFEGTGVGLATVQRIIRRHRGKVWAKSLEGEGATFYFTVPQRERDD